MAVPVLQLVLNDLVEVDWLRPLVAAGLDGVQVRARHETTRHLIAYVDALSASFPELDISVNALVDVALVTGIDAVQIPGHGIPIADIRTIAPHLRITASVHDLETAIAAERDGADAVTFGHIYPSASHPNQAPRGLDALDSVVQGVQIPVIAIGGIAPGTVASVRRRGATGIAVIGAIVDASDPAAEVRRIMKEWTSCD